MAINPLLKSICELPEVLRRVQADLTGPKLDQVKHVAQLLEIADEAALTSMGSAFYSLMPMHEALERAAFLCGRAFVSGRFRGRPVSDDLGKGLSEHPPTAFTWVPQDQSGACFETLRLGLEVPWMMIALALYFQLTFYQTVIARGIKPGEILDEGWVVA